MFRRKNAVDTQEKVVDPAVTAKALAKAMRDGDIVNFRLLFQPFSPARRSSSERFETAKYEYLLPDEAMEADPEFQACLALVEAGDTWRHIEQELEANRPPQLPSGLILRLADNAVREGKYTSAAQAYELLRTRARMQELFYAEGDRALAERDIARGVRGYVIGAFLEYDYAAFPEPLPVVPNYQTNALMLHGDYPKRPEESLPWQEHTPFLRTALGYLLNNTEAAARLEQHSEEVRVAFLADLVRHLDPGWNQFLETYRETCALTQRFGDRLQRSRQEQEAATGSLAEEIAQLEGGDPRCIPAQLIGRTLDGGEWWQYLKELAYAHPAGVLFVSRQMVGDIEIIMPRFRADSPSVKALGIAAAAS